MALCEGLGRSFTLTLLEVGAEDACDCFAPNYSPFGRVKVEDSEHMWHFVKALGGRSP